jgi:hypothetical protein
MLSTNQALRIRIRTMPMRPEWLEHIGELRGINRRGWIAVFNVNPSRELWPQFQYGRTSPQNRTQLRSRSRTLDRIARRLLRVRPEGGRFFIASDGAYMKDEQGARVQFIRFRDRFH